MQKCEYKLYNHTLILPLHGQHDHPKLYTKKTLTVWQSRGASDHMPTFADQTQGHAVGSSQARTQEARGVVVTEHITELYTC